MVMSLMVSKKMSSPMPRSAYMEYVVSVSMTQAVIHRTSAFSPVFSAISPISASIGLPPKKVSPISAIRGIILLSAP